MFSLLRLSQDADFLQKLDHDLPTRIQDFPTLEHCPGVLAQHFRDPRRELACAVDMTHECIWRGRVDKPECAEERVVLLAVCGCTVNESGAGFGCNVKRGQDWEGGGRIA